MEKTTTCHVKDCNNIRLLTSSKCKDCKTSYDKRRYFANLEYEKERAKNYNINNKEKRQKYYKENRLKRLIACARTRANNKSLAFNIDLEYIESLLTLQNNRCSYSGIIFKQGTPFAMSMDRINNSEGYIKGNIQLLCKIVNSGKLTISEKDYLKLIEKIYLNKIKN